MNCLVCNCHGAGSPTFLTTMKLYIQNYNPACIALLETKCNVNRAKNIFKSLGFDNFICQEGIGRGGGIWFAWKPNILTFFQIIVIIILFIYRFNWRI